MSPDRVRLELSQLTSKALQSVRLPLGITGFYNQILVFYVAQRAQPLSNAVVADVRGTPRLKDTNTKNFRSWLRVARRAKRKEDPAKCIDNEFHFFLLLLSASCLRPVPFDHPIRPGQHVGRNFAILDFRLAIFDCSIIGILCRLSSKHSVGSPSGSTWRLSIDHKFEPGRLLNGKIPGFGSF